MPSSKRRRWAEPRCFLKVFPDTPGRPAPVEGRFVTVVEHGAVRVVVLDSLLDVNQVAG